MFAIAVKYSDIKEKKFKSPSAHSHLVCVSLHRLSQPHMVWSQLLMSLACICSDSRAVSLLSALSCTFPIADLPMISCSLASQFIQLGPYWEMTLL